MARLEGTGKDPRYGAGEVFDVPAVIPDPGEASETIENPVYRELIDKGFANPVRPEDDPARSPTQIADAVVSGAGLGTGLTHPVDAKLADEFSGSEGVTDAYAKVHTGDATAKARQRDQDLDRQLRPSSFDGREDPRQADASPAYLGQGDQVINVEGGGGTVDSSAAEEAAAKAEDAAQRAEAAASQAETASAPSKYETPGEGS